MRVPEQRRAAGRVAGHLVGAVGLGPGHLLGPRVRDPAGVPDHVHDPQVELVGPAQAVGERAVLGRVDDDLGAGHGGGRGVDAGVVAGVLADVGALGGGELGRGEAGDVPGAFDGVAQGVHPVDVDVAPAAEGAFADRVPERAAGEALAAAAAFVLDDVALPQVHDLAERAHGGQLTEQAFDERCPASS